MEGPTTERDDNSQLITLNVGAAPNQRQFSIPRATLVEANKFFAARLSGRWPNKYGPIELPDEDPEDFAVYLECIKDGNSTVTNIQHFRPLAAICVISEKYIDDVRHNASLPMIKPLIYRTCTLCETGERVLDTVQDDVMDAVDIIYSGTQNTSARQLIVEAFSAFFGRLFPPQHETNLPDDFYQDLKVKFMKGW